MSVLTDVALTRNVNGKDVFLTVEERKQILIEWNTTEAAAVTDDALSQRENLIQNRMDKIVRDQAVVELIAEGKIT